MARSKEYRDLWRDANEKLSEWDNESVVPQSVEALRDALENFYRNAGKNVKDPSKFSTRVQLTEEQEEEFADLAVHLLNENLADYSTYEDFLFDKERSSVRERFDITTIEEAVDFIDLMNNFQSSDLMKEIMSSNQIAELFNEARRTGIDERSLLEIVYFEHSGTKQVGEELFDIVYGELQQYEKNDKRFRFD